MITAEQAEQAREIILGSLDDHHQGNLPWRQVWTKPTEDFDGVPFVKVWVIYEGDPSVLDIPRINSYPVCLHQALREAGIHALPSISYVSQSDADQLGAPWTG